MVDPATLALGIRFAQSGIQMGMGLVQMVSMAKAGVTVEAMESSAEAFLREAQDHANESKLTPAEKAAVESYKLQP